MKDLKLECLLSDAREVLEKLVKNDYLKNFVLVGGSALAIHLCHRQSEDLDFFTFKDEFSYEKIKKMTTNFDREIVNISNEQIDMFLDRVKVTFFNAKWKFLTPSNENRLNVATLEQLAIMKSNVLFLRAKYRDYYDLYFLTKKLGLRKIYELSKNTLEGINFKLFASALLYIDDIEDENIDYLMPKERITLKEIRNYFENELKGLK